MIRAALLILAISPAAYAGSDEDYIEKVKKFMEKKEPCKLATLSYIPSTTKMYPIEKYSTLHCVADMTHDKGTINEAEGCTYADYDVANGDYKAIKTGTYGVHMPMAKGKLCDKGGFEEVLKKGANAFCGKVESCLKESGNGMKTVLIYAEDSKYKDWFNSNPAKKGEK